MNAMRLLWPLVWIGCGAPAFAQPSTTFETADVRLNESGDVRMMVDFQPGGRFTARNVPMQVLIALAYQVRPDAVTGRPNWLGTARYDVVAKAAQSTSAGDLRLMLASLLVERFGLAIHKEDRPMPAYSLEVAKGGAKMQPAKGGTLSDPRNSCHAEHTGQCPFQRSRKRNRHYSGLRE